MAKDSATHNPFYTGTINDLNTREIDFSNNFMEKGGNIKVGVRIFAGSARFEVGPQDTVPNTSSCPVFDSTTNNQFFCTIKNDESSLFYTPAACGFACAVFF